jgi:hypothetical protein
MKMTMKRGGDMKLVLKIELCDEGMSGGADVANALLHVAHVIRSHGKGLKQGLSSNIKDSNGNTCGRWAIVKK